MSDQIDQNAQPMIRLEPGGQAPIISYNVPEPTSYSGKVFINLELTDGVLREGISLPALSPTSIVLYGATSMGLSPLPEMSPEGLRLGGTETYRLRFSGAPIPLSVVTNAGLLRMVSSADTGLRLVSSEPLSPELQGLDLDEYNAMLQAGFRLNVYRSLYGTLAYNYLPSNQTGSSGVTLRSRIGDAQQEIGENGDDPGSGGEEFFIVTAEIISPAYDAVLTGPPQGVSVQVEGTADAEGGGKVTGVQVKAGGQSVQATPASANDWSTWSCPLTLDQPGKIMIQAVATAKLIAGNKTETKTFTAKHRVTVVLTAPSGGGDSTAPTLRITTPADSALFSGLTTGVTVHIEGTASDEGGVARVEVFPDGNPASLVQATPKAANDWSTWSADLVFTTAGFHTMTARVVDAAGNTAETSLRVKVQARAPRKTKVTRLLLVEMYRLSSFRGNYGAGPVVKTFSLLPGEKTRISVRTYTRSTTNASQASSILDSFSSASANDFTKAVESEQASKQGFTESFNYHAGVEAGAAWGWGSAKISGGISGGSAAAREQSAKNITNATEKHAATASAKREVQINTSYEVKSEAGEETSIEREIQNINLSRTLNFVFRQMNQEFISMLHLVDVRVAYYREEIDEANPDPDLREVRTYREATLPQLQAFLEEVVLPGKVNQIKEDILHQLHNIFDYQDGVHDLVEEKALPDGSSYLRVKKNYLSTYTDPATGSSISVPGVITAVMKNTLRTEGVIVEALLGEGEALDPYSFRQRNLDLHLKQLEVERLKLELEKLKIQNELLKTTDRKTEVVIEGAENLTTELKLDLGVEDGQDTTIRFEDGEEG